MYFLKEWAVFREVDGYCVGQPTTPMKHTDLYQMLTAYLFLVRPFGFSSQSESSGVETPEVLVKRSFAWTDVCVLAFKRDSAARQAPI